MSKPQTLSEQLELNLKNRWLSSSLVFDDIDHGKTDEKILLRSKLEVQRIRLLHWGIAVGLGLPGKTSHPLPEAFKDSKIAQDVIEWLAAIERVIWNENENEKEFGIKKPSSLKSILMKSSNKRCFGFIFPTAYQSVLNPETKTRPLLLIGDVSQFMVLVATIREIINEVEKVVPDLSTSIQENISEEISISESKKQLQLLKNAIEGQDCDWMVSAIDKRLQNL